MKKIISCILAVLLAISCTCSVTFFANAMDSASFSIGSAESQAGGTVEVPIEISNNPGITSFRFVIEYDSVILKLINISFKEAAQGFNTGTSQVYDSPYSISGYNSGIDISNNGQLAVLTFEINQYAEEGKYDILLSYDEDDVFNMAGDNVPFVLNNGYVEVIPCQHTGGEWEYLEEESCTEDGIMIKRCDICGNEYERQTIDAKGHTFGDWVIEKPATCTEGGEKLRVCSVCTYEEREMINALGHKYPDEFTIDKAATCTENGEKSKYCTGCGERKDVSVIPAAGHSFAEWKTIVYPDCTNSGSKQRNCKNCGFIETENLNPNGHNWNSNYIIDIPATCTTDGSKSIHCANCDAVKDSTVIPSKGHLFGEYSITKPATCIDNGNEKRTCAVCNAEEARVINALGHNYSNEFIIDKAATCTDNGVKSKHCSRCDSKIDSTVIWATGHSYGEWIVEKAATKIERGTKYKACSKCDDKIYENIQKLPYIADSEDNRIDFSSDKITSGDDVQFTVAAAGSDNVNPISGDTRFIPAVWIVDGISKDFGNTQYFEIIKTDEMSIGEHTVEVLFLKQEFDGVQWINTDVTVTLTKAFVVEEKVSETVIETVTNSEQPAKPDNTAEKSESTDNNITKNTSKTSPNTGNTTLLSIGIYTSVALALGVICVSKKKKFSKIKVL